MSEVGPPDAGNRENPHIGQGIGAMDHQGQTHGTTLDVDPEQLMLGELGDRCPKIGITANLINRTATTAPVLVVERLGIVLEITVRVRHSCKGPEWVYWIETWDYCLTDASDPVVATGALGWFLKAKAIEFPGFP
jgi:hypothetical protein